MGLRFRKIISILPGLRLNVSKSGVSTSLGGRGATVNVGANGKRTVTVGIGLSYQAPLNMLSALLVVAAILVLGIVYLIAPQQVQQLLHAWQPKWF
jgi:hypothetical protein